MEVNRLRGFGRRGRALTLILRRFQPRFQLLHVRALFEPGQDLERRGELRFCRRTGPLRGQGERRMQSHFRVVGCSSGRLHEQLGGLGRVAQQINVIHVVGEKELKGTSAMEVQKTRKQIRTRLDEICAVFEDQGISSRSHVYVGEPTAEIERAARECQATMVVLGSSGKASWKERWLGSIPRDVAEKSVFPTLLIPMERP